MKDEQKRNVCVLSDNRERSFDDNALFSEIGPLIKIDDAKGSGSEATYINEVRFHRRKYLIHQ